MSLAGEKFDDLDFESLEQAVRQSAKGRWFLEQYSQRLKSRETTIILAAISKLETALTNQVQPVDAIADQPLRPNQLKYFKQDEELFEAPKVVSPVATMITPQPEAKGARIRITRSDTPIIIGATGLKEEPYIAAEPQEQAVTAADGPASITAEPSTKPRIIITRQMDGDGSIPLLDDDGQTGAAE